jgi:hypothetical protein
MFLGIFPFPRKELQLNSDSGVDVETYEMIPKA